MVSPELIRRYSYFGGFSNEEIIALAKAADELTVDKEFYFFREGEPLDHMYLVIEGEVALSFRLPEKNKEIIFSTISTGDVFGWSGLVEPYIATADAKSISTCRVISFDCKTLRQKFEEDCHFGFVMMTKVAQILRDRLRDYRIETLAFIS